MDFFTIESINKEQIPELECSPTEVLTCHEEIEVRKASIDRAAYLSKSFYLKARIIFDTSKGTKEVLTTIWAATDNFIVMKGGVTLPVHCVRGISVPLRSAMNS
jgi:hypothetical protein